MYIEIQPDGTDLFRVSLRYNMSHRVKYSQAVFPNGIVRAVKEYCLRVVQEHPGDESLTVTDHREGPLPEPVRIDLTDAREFAIDENLLYLNDVVDVHYEEDPEPNFAGQVDRFFIEHNVNATRIDHVEEPLTNHDYEWPTITIELHPEPNVYSSSITLHYDDLEPTYIACGLYDTVTTIEDHCQEIPGLDVEDFDIINRINHNFMFGAPHHNVGLNQLRQGIRRVRNLPNDAPRRQGPETQTVFMCTVYENERNILCDCQKKLLMNNPERIKEHFDDLYGEDFNWIELDPASFTLNTKPVHQFISEFFTIVCVGL